MLVVAALAVLGSLFFLIVHYWTQIAGIMQILIFLPLPAYLLYAFYNFLLQRSVPAPPRRNIWTNYL